MSTYYVKQGRRYVPVGMSGPELYDGIWLVQTNDHGRSLNNLYLRLADVPECHDLTTLASGVMLEDSLATSILKAYRNNKLSPADVARSIVADLVKTKSATISAKSFRKRQ